MQGQNFQEFVEKVIILMSGIKLLFKFSHLEAIKILFRTENIKLSTRHTTPLLNIEITLESGA